MSRSPSPAAAGAVRVAVAVASLALLVGACGAATSPTAPPASSGATPAATPSATPPGPTAIVVDTDLSFDDILALAFLLRQPEVDVRAVTVTGTGLVHCLSGLQVMARLLATLERPDVPVACGREEPLAGGHVFPASWREVADDAYGLALEAASVANPASTAPELVASIAAAAGAPITVVALGPLTNLADALAADPALTTKVSRIVEMGGAVAVTGNVATDPDGVGSPGPAEWNVYADPAAADAVFRSGIPITLVPLDATEAVPVDQAFVDALGADHAAAGADIAYELLARRGVNGFDYLWDALAAVVVVDESVVTIEPMNLEVITEEGPDSGRTARAEDGTEIRVAIAADRAAFEERFLAGLRLGAPRPTPWSLSGTITVTFDGTTCTDDAADTIATGDWLVQAETTAAGWSFFALLAFHEGSGWNDLLAYMASAPDPTTQPPFVDVPAYSLVEGAGSARFVASLEAGTHGLVCLYGTGDEQGSVAPSTGGPFTVAP